MSNKNFNTLAIVTVVLMVVSILMSGKKEVIVADFVRGQDLIGYLDVDRLDCVEVQKGEDKIVVQKQGDRFLVESRSSYPADGGRINNLIDMCLKLRCMREISDTADTHADLGVDEANPDATIVRFKAGDKKTQAEEFARRIAEAAGAGVL